MHVRRYIRIRTYPSSPHIFYTVRSITTSPGVRLLLLSFFSLHNFFQPRSRRNIYFSRPRVFFFFFFRETRNHGGRVTTTPLVENQESIIMTICLCHDCILKGEGTTGLDGGRSTPARKLRHDGWEGARVGRANSRICVTLQTKSSVCTGSLLSNQE